MPSTQALPSELSIYTVADLHAQWLAWLGPDLGGEALVLDGGAVEQADAAGVQLLLALDAALKKRGTTLALRDPSPPLLQACSALGLGEWAAARHQQQGQTTA